MDLMHLPWPWYFTNHRNVTGTYILGFIGVVVTLIACVACWYQIKNIKDDD